MRKNPPPPFPRAIYHRGRLCFLRRELNVYKDRVILHSLGGDWTRTPDSLREPDEIEIFVPASVTAEELGISRRTIGRLIADPNARLGNDEGKAA